MKSVIIYGAIGCGKTYNAEKFRKHFGLITIKDGWSPSDGNFKSHGVLYLTNVLMKQERDRRILEFTKAKILLERQENEINTTK